MISLKSFRRAAIGAVSIVGCGLSVSALALPASQWSADPAQVLNVYYGGATATDNVLENLMIDDATGICQNTGTTTATTTVDIFRVTTSNQGQRVVFCQVRAGITGLVAGTKLAFHKESVGGSSNGVVPIARNQQLAFINMGTAGSCTGPTFKAAAGGNMAYNEWNCNGLGTTLQNPNGGISDVEAQLAFDVLTSAELNRLNVARGIHVVFGVPVNLNLYRALQIAQGLPQDDLPANVPSLTRSQIRGIYAGRLTSWNQLLVGSTALTAAVGITPPVNAAGGVASDAIFICRRVGSSGTQAAYDTYWLNARCDAKRGSTASPAFVAPNDGSTDTIGAAPNAAVGRVNASEGSGDVRNCFAYHQTNGTWAIGTLSTEVNSSQAANLRMVRVDGALPNLSSVANGDYDFFTENNIHRLKAAEVGAPTGDVLDVLTFIETNIGKASFLKNLNIAFQGRPWGDGGSLGIHGLFGNLANAGLMVDGSSGVGTIRDNPVNTQSRALLTNRTNNCYPPVMVRPSPTP